MYHIQHALSARMWLHISSSLGPQRTFICPSSPADLAIRQKFYRGWKQGSWDVLGKRSTLTFWKNYDHDANLYKSNKHSLFDFVCFCRYRWRLRFDSRKHASHTLFHSFALAFHLYPLDHLCRSKEEWFSGLGSTSPIYIYSNWVGVPSFHIASSCKRDMIYKSAGFLKLLTHHLMDT